MRSRFPDVRVIRFDRNLGFAEGNNRAAAEVEGEWVGFLNNDMWVPPDWLSKLVAPLEQQPELASLASRIANWDGSAIDFIGGGVNLQGYGFHFEPGAPSSPRDRSGRVLFACGGAMLVRRELFLEAGGFDPDYFIYYEDVDLGWRLNVMGYDVWYTSEASVNHRHHGTTGTWNEHRRRVLYDRNALFTMFKNLDDENLRWALPATLVLLNEKALRTAGANLPEWIMGPRSEELAAELASDTPVPAGTPPTMAGRAWRALREEGVGGVARRAARRLPGRRTPRRRLSVATEVLSPLVSISEFGRRLPVLLERRGRVQSARRRSDEELMPLFHFMLHPSFPDGRYVRFHERLTRALGFDERFRAGQDWKPL